MNKSNMKILVTITYNWFRGLLIDQRKEVLLRYLTPEALNILVKQKMKEGDVPQAFGIIDSTGLCYLLIGKDLFKFCDESPFICVNCGQKSKKEKRYIKLRKNLIFCSKKCYRNYRIKQELLLNKRTKVRLKRAAQIRQEWYKKEPFHQAIPSEISFVCDEENQFLTGGFNWKISIPDILDQYYWPLIKKEMTSINLHFQTNNRNHNNSTA
ncbi:MAG: hypothetical protein ACFFAU_09475 [Candidatus Hodarchaeota archaeon]